MDDFKPFLQIVHISDLHVSDPKSAEAAGLRNWIRKLRKVLPDEIMKLIEDGTAPHDQLAVGLFKRFLTEITSNDPDWAQCKTWLLDTGDLTSLGDQNSLKLGKFYLGELKKVCPEQAGVYGNHDAWPGKFPAWAASSDFDDQKKVLAGQDYTVGSPGLALTVPIPHGHGDVRLFFVDSIKHDRINNTLALGEVGTPQLGAFRTLVDLNYQADRRDLRILAVHHPVHYPPPRSSFQMSMKDDANVAKEIDTPAPNGPYPLAHLVLSGHTHYLYPQHGSLPLQPSKCIHPDLGDDECQFVVGTLMQLDKYDLRGRWPHQCVVLRLYYSPSDPSVLLMERLLAARQTGLEYRGTGFGPYGFVPLQNNAGEIAEEITFTL
ncbi:MAG TPA: metallophosphoesterase [Pyrinomonadaceae bacterium]|nr:metallophosphoesterase [Pyrinomonadaceae bacterium]